MRESSPPDKAASLHLHCPHSIKSSLLRRCVRSDASHDDTRGTGVCRYVRVYNGTLYVFCKCIFYMYVLFSLIFTWPPVVTVSFPSCVDRRTSRLQMASSSAERGSVRGTAITSPTVASHQGPTRQILVCEPGASSLML